jgi:hypothetical protein
MPRRRVLVIVVVCALAATLLTQAGAPAVQVRRASMPGTADVAQAPNNKGFWTVDVRGAVEARDGAKLYGTLASHALNHPVVGMASTRSGRGYWLVASDGGVFAFGDARFHGSLGSVRLNEPIVGIAATASGNGYWLSAADGGVFSFGDARFHGSTGGLDIVQPIMDIAGTPSGAGYWLVAADGGIFAFGDAQFRGSASGLPLNSPVVDMTGTPSGKGYWMLGNDGGIYSYGDAAFFGSTSGTALGHAAALTSETHKGYMVALSTGSVAVFGEATLTTPPTNPPTTTPPTTRPPTTNPPTTNPPTTRPPTTNPPTTNPPTTNPPTTNPPTTTPTTQARPPSTGPTSADEALGFYPHNPNSDGMERFFAHERWLGRDIEYFTAFGESSSVTNFNSNLNGQLRSDRLGQWDARGQRPPFRLVYSLPLAFGDHYGGNAAGATVIRQQWETLVSGGEVRSGAATGYGREFYRSFARRLVDAGHGNAIIRLASEHDLVGSKWASAVDYALFKSAFRTAVDAMREVAPGLEIDFTSIRMNFGKGPNPGSKVLNAYPGDQWVDYIGMNIYDMGQVPDDIGVPSGRTCGWRNPQAVFDTLHRPSLDTALRFAMERGKRLSLPEWGLAGGGRNAVGSCGGDNPVFVSNIHGWLDRVPAAHLGYASYFEGNPAHSGPHQLDYFPVARNTFGSLFRG